MIEVKSLPQLRFPEFSECWKYIKLGEVAHFSKGKNVSKDEVTEDGLNECIRYGELYTTYNETISEVFSKTNLSLDESVVSQANDVIIPASGETQLDIATASCVLREGIILGGDLNIIRTTNSGVFLSYYLNNKGRYDIARLSQGSSVVHLYSKQLSRLKINFPALPEQQKIASFLTAVDDKITQLIRKKALLKQYKKGLMQQLFSQELRFKDDDGKDYPDWEMKKLKEVATKRSSNISANSIEENVGNYKIYGASGFLKEIDFYREEEPYISIVKDGAGVGRTLLCEPYSSVLGTLDVIQPKWHHNLYFIYCLLNNLSFRKYITGSTIPHIYFKDYSKEKIKLPCFVEQTKIANFLSAIDHKITLVDSQIEKTTVFKKGLLQQMFV